MDDKEKSNIHVTGEGRVLKDISDKVEVLCPTCKGKKTIPDPSCMGKPMFYCDQKGNSIPQIPCRTCNGEGWVLTNKA